MPVPDELDDNTAAAAGATGAGSKLVPEWGLDGDNQIIVVGVAIFALLLGGLGLRTWLDSDDDIADDPIEEVSSGGGSNDDDIPAITTPPDATTVTTVAVETTAPAVETTVAATTVPATTTAPETTAAPTTTAAPATTAAPEPDPAAEVAASVSSLVGVTGTAKGDVAVLTGFVDNDGQFADAAASAAAVDGIESVDNQLVIVQPAALTALSDAGVANAEAAVNDLVVFARGQVPDEAARQAAIDALAAVPGVASVVDELVVGTPDFVEELNQLVELDPVQFATSSSEILEASFPTLDRAAEIILSANVEGLIGVHGYTDIRGDEDTNLALSSERAEAVANYLIDKGVPAGILTSQGFGESTQFGEGNSPEALAANRRVLFVLSS